MGINLANNARRNSIIVAIIILIALMAVFTLLSFIPSHSIKTIFAVITITVAVGLPIQQKRFSLSFILILVSGILFLLSGVIDDAYHTVVSPLPVLQQIEFSKVMQPMQVSRGMWQLGIGILNVMLAVVWFQTKETSEKPKSKRLKFFLLMRVVDIMG